MRVSIKSASLLFLLAVSACSGGANPPTADETSSPATALATPTTTNEAVATPTTTNEAELTLVEKVSRAKATDFLVEPDDLRSTLRELGFVPLVLQTGRDMTLRKNSYMTWSSPFCPTLKLMIETLNPDSASTVKMRVDSQKFNQAEEANPEIPLINMEVFALFGITNGDFQDALDEINAAAGGRGGCTTDAFWMPAARPTYDEDSSLEPIGTPPYLFKLIPVADRTKTDAGGGELKVFTHINPVLWSAVKYHYEDQYPTYFKRITSTAETSVRFLDLTPDIRQFSKDGAFALSVESNNYNMLARSLSHFPEHEVAIFIRMSVTGTKAHGEGSWSNLTSDELDAHAKNVAALHATVLRTTKQKLIAFADGTVSPSQP